VKEAREVKKYVIGFFLIVTTLLICSCVQHIPNSHRANRRSNCKFCHNPDALIRSIQINKEDEIEGE